MDPVNAHKYAPDLGFDGGDLDCGSGLLLLIRKHIDKLVPGQLLEILSSESSVVEDLPAWCRLTSNELVSWTRSGKQASFLVSKGPFAGSTRALASGSAGHMQVLKLQPVAVKIPDRLPDPVPAPVLPPLAVMGIGSWPRAPQMVHALHAHLCGQMGEGEFQSVADEAVRQCVQAQLDAGADVITDGEQRRDNYASFVGNLLDNCALIPLVDLLPLVDEPEKFREEMNSLDVPADKVRHPAVFGPLGRSRALAVDEFAFVRKLTDKPVKVALPGPYLLTRMMWVDCLRDNAYQSREALAADIVRVLREEMHYLLAAGVTLVQLDEPVLSEAALGKAGANRTFMCGALSERLEGRQELNFACELINATVAGLPSERTAMHVCRGNWTPDESLALSGDYSAYMPVLTRVNVGTLLLEFCTSRAGDLALIKQLPDHLRIGIGVVNPKDARVESPGDIAGRIKQACDLVGKERLLLTPDCGFATFADNPVSAFNVAEGKLRAIKEALTGFSL